MKGRRPARAPGSSAASLATLAGVLVGLVLMAAAPRADTSRSPAGQLYVPNQDDATISVIDTGAREVVRTIDLRDLGFPPDARPHDVIAEPDGSAWYVSLIGADVVLKFDASDELVARAEFEAPGMLALHPRREILYVGRSMKAVNPPPRIGRIETSEMTVEEVEVLFPRPHALAVGPGGEHVHVGSLAVNRIATLATGTGRVELTGVEGPVHVFVQFAVSPDGERMVATGQMSGRLMVFDRTRPDELPVLATVPVGAEPWHPVYTPDGRYVVFGNKAEDTVTVVDTETWEVAAVIEGPGLSQPHGAAVDPDGCHVYISSNNLDGEWSPEGSPGGEATGSDAPPPGAVTVIDMESRSVVDVIEVGRNPNGLGLRPTR